MLRDIFCIEHWRALLSSTTASQTKHYDEVEVQFMSEGNRLSGTLTLPSRRGTLPNTIAILIHGSGKMDRDETNHGHKPFAVISHELSQQGVAVLRFDKRGVGASKGDYDSATTFDFVQDVLAAIRFIGTNLQNGQDKLVLIGHSEGGMIAALAAKASPHVDGIVMLAAPAVRGDELMLAQIAYNCRVTNLSDELAKAQLSLAKSCYDVVKIYDEDPCTIRRLKALIAEKPDVVRDAPFLLARIDPNKITSNWYRAYLSYDPRPALRMLECPVLAVHGLNDRQVMAEDSLPEMRAALAQSAADYSVVEVHGVNHIMQNSPTGATSEYDGIEQSIDPMIIGLVRNFIQTGFKR